MFKWGHVTEAEYRKEDAEVRAQIAALPSESGKVIEFSRYRRIAASLPDALAAATPEQIAELMPALVARLDVKDRKVATLTWTPHAEPLFREPEPGTAAESSSPRADSNRRRQP
jgi:hypothetical protein